MTSSQRFADTSFFKNFIEVLPIYRTKYVDAKWTRSILPMYVGDQLLKMDNPDYNKIIGHTT